ncbi:hypothetical protein F4802DRAFT_597283 [Xylaria palmicola]|nr:hypothetical protein F4802DRAFT_597283 [Xylaria palmicola]
MPHHWTRRPQFKFFMESAKFAACSLTCVKHDTEAFSAPGPPPKRVPSLRPLPNRLPNKIMNRIFYYLEEPYKLPGRIVWAHLHTPLSIASTNTMLILEGARQWADIPTLQICHNSRQYAIERYGQPSPQAFPFYNRKDSISLRPSLLMLEDLTYLMIHDYVLYRPTITPGIYYTDGIQVYGSDSPAFNKYLGYLKGVWYIEIEAEGGSHPSNPLIWQSHFTALQTAIGLRQLTIIMRKRDTCFMLEDPRHLALVTIGVPSYMTGDIHILQGLYLARWALRRVRYLRIEKAKPECVRAVDKEQLLLGNRRLWVREEGLATCFPQYWRPETEEEAYLDLARRMPVPPDRESENPASPAESSRSESCSG